MCPMIDQPDQPLDKRSQPGNQRLSVIPARAVTDPDLSDGAFRTLAAIGVFGDRNGWCYPSYSTLAKMRGVSKQAISKHVAELVERGYLNVYHRYDKATGAQQTSMLQIRFDYEPEDAADDAAERRPRQRRVDPPSTPEVDPPSTPEVDAINLTPQVNDTHTCAEAQVCVRGQPNEKAASPDDFPDDCREGVRLLNEIFGLPIPNRPEANKPGGEYATWIKGIRRLAEVAREYDVSLERALRMVQRDQSRRGYLVSRPQSLVNPMIAVLAEYSLLTPKLQPIQSELAQRLATWKPRGS